MLTPGKYRIIELASRCGVSRTTAEKFIQRYDIPETIVSYNGREVAGVELSFEKIETIAKDYPRVLQGNQEGMSNPIETPVIYKEDDNNTLIEDLKERINTAESEKSQALRDVSDKRVEIAILEGEVKRLEDIVKQLEARLLDKDALIESSKAEADAQKSRAESFNNQIASYNSLVQYNKGAASQFEELKQLMLESKSKTVIEVNENAEQPAKKGFRIFGIEISRASNRWEGSMSKRRLGGTRKRPRYYQ